MTKAFICGCADLRLNEDERAFFEAERPWGLILFRRNVSEPAQVADLVAAFREAVGRADAPVLIDQEGGRVQRLKPPHWPDYPPGRHYGRLFAGDREAGERAAWLGARLIAHDLHRLGIDVDCLPVLDVPSAAGHAVIGDRAYGEDVDTVVTLASAAADGLMSGGVLPVAKHVPGHGRAAADSHLELPRVLASAADHENKVVIITGTGDRFSTEIDPDFDLASGEAIAKVHWEGHRILRNLADIEAPVISAINGPLTMHCFPLLADITLCTDQTTFQDPHVISGVAAGDGAQIVWNHLIGPVRANYFLLTGQVIDSAEALRLGVVNEVLPAEDLLTRAWQLARDLAKQPQTALRYTRAATATEWRRLLQDLPMSYALQNLGTTNA